VPHTRWGGVQHLKICQVGGIVPILLPITEPEKGKDGMGPSDSKSCFGPECGAGLRSSLPLGFQVNLDLQARWVPRVSLVSECVGLESFLLCPQTIRWGVSVWQLLCNWL
jgi:hypothetical protein